MLNVFSSELFFTQKVDKRVLNCYLSLSGPFVVLVILIVQFLLHVRCFVKRGVYLFTLYVLKKLLYGLL